MTMTRDVLLLRVRVLLALFIAGLVVAGATAIPLVAEIDWLTRMMGVPLDGPFADSSWLEKWTLVVHHALFSVDRQYPFLFYGTDWLAFGHFAIAILFIGPLKDPVRNRWVVDAGILLCALIIPFAFGMGSLRGIPFLWQLIDCSFGVFGAIPLLLCRAYIRRLEAMQTSPSGR